MSSRRAAQRELYSHHGICQPDPTCPTRPTRVAHPTHPTQPTHPTRPTHLPAPRVRDDTGMGASGKLNRGREAHAREAWSDARTLLAEADREAPLEPEDLERLAAATFLVGEEAACIDALTRAHHGYLQHGDPIGAARNAIRLAHTMVQHPALQAQATGWLARARRLLDECDADCGERGFLLCAEAFFQARANDQAVAGA